MKLWSGGSQNSNDTIDNAYQKFKIDVNSSQLDINNIAGEQHLLTSLNKITDTHGTPESLELENQHRFVKLIRDKIPKNSPLEPHSPEMPTSPILDPIQDSGPNVIHNPVVAPLVPNQVGSNQKPPAALGPQQTNLERH
jgi:hypothetical protein